MCSFCSEHTKGSENIKEVSRPIPLNDEDGADLPELEDKKYNTDSASASSDEQSDNCSPLSMLNSESNDYDQDDEPELEKKKYNADSTSPISEQSDNSVFLSSSSVHQDNEFDQDDLSLSPNNDARPGNDTSSSKAPRLAIRQLDTSSLMNLLGWNASASDPPSESPSTATPQPARASQQETLKPRISQLLEQSRSPKKAALESSLYAEPALHDTSSSTDSDALEQMPNSAPHPLFSRDEKTPQTEPDEHSDEHSESSEDRTAAYNESVKREVRIAAEPNDKTRSIAEMSLKLPTKETESPLDVHTADHAPQPLSVDKIPKLEKDSTFPTIAFLNKVPKIPAQVKQAKASRAVKEVKPSKELPAEGSKVKAKAKPKIVAKVVSKPKAKPKTKLVSKEVEEVSKELPKTVPEELLEVLSEGVGEGLLKEKSDPVPKVASKAAPKQSKVAKVVKAPVVVPKKKSEAKPRKMSTQLAEDTRDLAIEPSVAHYTNDVSNAVKPGNAQIDSNLFIALVEQMVLSESENKV